MCLSLLPDGLPSLASGEGLDLNPHDDLALVYCAFPGNPLTDSPPSVSFVFCRQRM